jgi:hypothetical protein
LEELPKISDEEIEKFSDVQPEVAEAEARLVKERHRI